MTNYCSRYLIRVSWLERHLDMVEVPGSSPVTPTTVWHCSLAASHLMKFGIAVPLMESRAASG